MTPLPPPLGSGELVVWRLELHKHAATWAEGEGARLFGGRWNARGQGAVYTSLDPSTAILEVAVHRGFAALDTVAHTMTSARVTEAARVHVLNPEDIPERSWLQPGLVSEAQQHFGERILRSHGSFVVPSTVASHSWNLVMDPVVLHDLLTDIRQEPFVLDPRLNAARK